MEQLLVAGAVAAAGTAAWVAHRMGVTANYAVDRIGAVKFERFPAAQREFSRVVAVTGGCGRCSLE